jgi:hypothetical protein
MASIENSELIFDIGDPTKAGLYRDFNSTAAATIGTLVSRNGLPLKFRLVRPSLVESRPWTDVNFSGATIDFALSEAEIGPSTGNWSLSYNSDTTGLTALSAAITNTALQAALNANPAIAAGGGSVTVQKFTGLHGKITFSVTWNQVGVRFLLGGASVSLFPLSTVGVCQLQAGNAGTVEIQIIEIAQAPYAYTNAFTPYTAGAMSITNVQSGTATKRSMQRVVFNVQPYDGTYILNCPIPEITNVTPQANIGVKNVTTVRTIADAAGSLEGTYFDIYDDSGPVRCWMSFGGAAAPPTPTGGRNLAITGDAVNDSANTVATKIKTIVDADAKFDATVTANLVTITDASRGLRNAGVDVNTGFTVSTTVAGNDGPLAGQYFVLQDVNGSVGIWFRTPNVTAIPAGAASCWRNVPITLTTNDVASAVETAINTAMSADTYIPSTSTLSPILIFTDTTGGARPAASQGSTTFSVVQKQAGTAISATVPLNVSADAFKALLGGFFDATKAGDFDWLLTGAKVGAMPAITVDDSQLAFANGITGTLNLNTWGMFLKFTATSEPTIQLALEGRITFAGEKPFTFYKQPVTIDRTVIELSTIAPVDIGGGGGGGGGAFGTIKLADETRAVDGDPVENLVMDGELFVAVKSGERWAVIVYVYGWDESSSNSNMTFSALATGTGAMRALYRTAAGSTYGQTADDALSVITMAMPTSEGYLFRLEISFKATSDGHLGLGWHCTSINQATVTAGSSIVAWKLPA